MRLWNRLRRKRAVEPRDAVAEVEAALFDDYPPKPPVLIRRAPTKVDRSDFIIASLGIALGLTCAMFPWYIFFNQEKFGVREMVFEGNRSTSVPSQINYQPQRIGAPFSSGEVPRMELDFLPTATTRGDQEPARAIPASEQPFPSDLVRFSLVHVANGRAMIKDEDGLWIVQPGSQLPDASRVAAIEERDGKWVLVTTLDKVIELPN